MGGSSSRVESRQPSTLYDAQPHPAQEAPTAATRPQRPLFEGREVHGWERGDVIGHGASGEVYEAIEEESERYFCVKAIKFPDGLERPAERRRFDAVCREVALLRELSHPNIVRFLGVDHDDTHVYVQMELVCGGSLHSLIASGGALDEGTAANFTRQIVDGLVYLHQRDVVHRDIKGANILVGTDGTAKLADFGASKQMVDAEELSTTLAGTPYWMAPEVVRQHGHNAAADVWSLGATVLEMLTGAAPYQHLPSVAALFRIGHGAESPVPDTAVLSAEARDFIALCLQRDPSRRPTAASLRQHAWLQRASASVNVVVASPALAPEVSLGATTLQNTVTGVIEVVDTHTTSSAGSSSGSNSSGVGDESSAGIDSERSASAASDTSDTSAASDAVLEEAVAPEGVFEVDDEDGLFQRTIGV